MAISLSSISQVLRPGVLPSKKKKTAPKEDLSPKAAFKRKYGILSTAGKAKKAADRVDSDWGFPLPPSGSPNAKRFARAVLSRAHQAKNYDAADVDRQVRRAKAILGVKHVARRSSKTSEHARRMREYGITAAGSWEQQCGLIQKAAALSPQFGAPGNGEIAWGITLVASYPAKNAVIVGNMNTGELWAATYTIDANDCVTFPLVKKAKQTFALAESRRMKTASGESATTVKPKKMSEAIRLHARVREVKATDDGGVTADCVMLEEGPGNPVDGHYYTGDLIERIAENGVFEGARSYADHQDDIEGRARGGVRSIKDLIGWWSDVHTEESGGKKLLVGTLNIEAGNVFALNKMREAKRYAERYKDDPRKQYVGFSIFASGESERSEVDGKPYKVVLDITEADSTDMVACAGAGGRLLSLKEEGYMGSSLASTREEKKLLESLIDGISKKLRPGLAARTAAITESQFSAVLKEAGVELDDDAKGKMHAALAKVMSGKPGKKAAIIDDEDAEDDEMEDETGDPSLDGILEPDDDDDDDVGESDDEDDEDADLIGGEGKKKKEGARKSAREIELERQLREAKLREKAQLRALMAVGRETARKLVAEGVVGNVARTRESGVRGGGLLTVSGVEKG
jgi:hypothetical protein